MTDARALAGLFSRYGLLFTLTFALGCSHPSGSDPCPSGQSACDGTCVNTTSDPDHCGGCARACGADLLCSQGTCGKTCTDGLLACGRSCIDTSTDVTHCGSCDTRCGAGMTCQSGRCAAVVMECKDRLALRASGVFDVDLPTVQVSGKLTKNGATLPDGTYRGALVFVHKRGGAVTMPSFSDTREASYKGEVFAGTYDVLYQPSPYCRSGGALPCQSLRLRTDVPILSSGVLDFDVQTVQISGKLTKKTARLADDTTDRGAVVFSLQDGGGLSMPSFGQTGEASYKGELFAGTYDVRYQPSPYCRSGGALPCQSLSLRKKVALNTSGALDFDVQTVQLSGKLTKNGAKLTDDTTDRGAVVFSIVDGGDLNMPSFGQTAEASYKGEVFAGTYDVRYQPSPYCRSGGALPCQSLSLRKKVALNTPGALDFDVQTVQLSGKLTKNGAKLADDTTDRGSVVFSIVDGGARMMPSFGQTGEASYKGEVFAGTYDIQYQPSPYCKSGGALPCQSLSLRKKTALNSSGALDFDVQTVQLSGKLTKNGTKLPDDTTDRGSVVFSIVDGGARMMPSFGQSGEARYQGEIFAGTYDVRYQPSPYCRSGGALPCQDQRLKEAVALTGTGALDFDLAVVDVSGAVTKNAARVPDDTTDRGAVSFSVAGTSTRTLPSLGQTGGARYQGEIFAGSYDVSYQPSPYCRSGGALPCQSLLLKGCPVPTP